MNAHPTPTNGPPTSTEGLAALEARLRRAMGNATSHRFALRWQVDGRLFLRLRVHVEDGRLRYVWLDETDPGLVRREIAGLDELEGLVKRQLIEPGGEGLCLTHDEDNTPIVAFWAIVAEGDRLRCVWTTNDPSP